MDSHPAHEYLTHPEVLARTVEVEGKRVADVGCGAGQLVRWLRTRGADVVGIECGEVMRAQAMEADPDNAGDYLDGVGEDLPLPDDSVDVVIYSYSLHHVPHEVMDDALREARRVLRHGGTLYVVEPAPTGGGHEVVRVVDDETAKRAHAQDALDRADHAGLAQLSELRYQSRMVVVSADELATRIVGIDPRRAQRMSEVRDEFTALFHRHAAPVEGGYALETENLVRVFRAV